MNALNDRRRSLFYWHSEGLAWSGQSQDKCIMARSANLVDFMLVVASLSSECRIAGPDVIASKGVSLVRPKNVDQLRPSLIANSRLSIVLSLPSFLWDTFFGVCGKEVREADVCVSVGLSGTGTFIGLVRGLLFRRRHVFVVRGDRLETVRTSSRGRFSKYFALLRVGLYDKVMRRMVLRSTAEIWFQGRGHHHRLTKALGSNCSNRLKVLDAVLRDLPDIPVIRKSNDLVYTGRLTVEKGLLELIEALAFLAARNIRVTLSIVGQGPDELRLRNAAAEAGVQEQITWHGFVSDPKEILRILVSARLFVLPSYTEGLPRSLLEAMWCGVPCVTTPVGGIPYVLEDRKTAFFSPVADSKGLANILQQALEMEKDCQLSDMVSSARNVAAGCRFNVRAAAFMREACREQ